MNSEDRGIYLGAFNSEDKILIIFNDGTYEMTTFDFSNRFKMSDIKIIEKYDNSRVYTLLHFEGKIKKYYLKRFKIDIHSIGKRYLLISENRGSKLLLVSSEDKLNILYNYKTKRGEKKSKIVLNYDIVNIKGWKALGNRLDNKSRMSAFSFQPLDNEIINDNNLELNLF